MGKRPGEELYDVKQDPHCVDNLALDPDNGLIQAELRRRLEDYCRQTGDPRMVGKGDYFDTLDYVGVDELVTVYKMWQKVKASGGQFWWKERWPRHL
jgi:hypothetical protein